MMLRQIIDMTATAYQELEAVVIDVTDAELKVGLDKILHNTTADEASNIDTTSLQGYTFSNNEGKEVTIWSDNESDEISFNGSEL